MTQLSPPMLIMSKTHHVREQGKTRVRRILFEERVDHDETRRILEKEMLKIQREDARRWNFNFAEERPLEGRFDWVRVTEPEATHAYALRRMPYCGAHSTASASATADNLGPSPTTPQTEPGTSTSSIRRSTTGSTAGDASDKERVRQTSVTDFFLRKRKRSETVKASTETQVSNEKVGKLPKAS